jgi:hypothetical protein
MLLEGQAQTVATPTSARTRAILGNQKRNKVRLAPSWVISAAVMLRLLQKMLFPVSLLFYTNG